MTNIDLVGTSFSSNKPYLFRGIYDWILDNDGTPYLLVDANHELAQVPNEHVKDGQIILNASPDAIQNWFSDNEAVSFSARFSGKSQQIYIPMDALLAIYAQENSLGMAFPESIEKEATEKENISESSQSTVETEKAEKKAAKPSKPSHLKVVK